MLSFNQFDDDGMLRWHDLLPVRDVIDRKTAPINDSYLLVFGDEPAPIGAGQAVATGYTDFRNRRCWVNAELLDAETFTSEDQFISTVYIAAHERAHARLTDY